MNLESLAIDPRSRHPWEAMDLGIAFYRSAWRRIFLLWFSVTLPVILLLTPLFAYNLWLGWMVVWWLKPLYDRVLLHYFSYQAFGGDPDNRQSLRAIPSLLGTGLLACLTVYRFDPGRSFNLSVWQLEHLKGRRRWNRAGVLNNGYRGYAMALTLACSMFEFVIQLGFIILAWLVLEPLLDWSFFQALTGADESQQENIVWLIAYYVAISAVEPLYVAAGFALYLNRRIELEAWDIDVRFRRMQQRLSALKPSITGALGTLMLCATLWAGLSVAPDALAQDLSDENTVEEIAPDEDYPEPVSIDTERARGIVDRVYADPVFGEEITDSGWRWKERESEEREETEPTNLSPLGRFLASIVKMLLILSGIAAAGWLLWMLFKSGAFRSRKTGSKPKPAKAEKVAGLDIRRKSLPDDIPAAARKLLADGDSVAALSLLYRGTLSLLVRQQSLPLRNGFTEGDCLNTVQAHCSDTVAGYFKQLTRLWLVTAYGGLQPAAETAGWLINQWAKLFQQPAAPSVEQRHV